jgi:A/G-specific adenine glycosylase
MRGEATQFRLRLLRWYDRHRRDLPWRVSTVTRATRRIQGLPDSYHVLVSEAMLQQTQVAAVVPYFVRFLQKFPTLRRLAQSEEQDVLRLWQGLGYYSRARNLRAAAQKIMAEHEGQIPRDVEALRKLPGVGRYTAGAIASIAFDQRAPILDGNVARVLCRLDRIETDPRESETQKTLWRRAEEVLPARRCGDFNSAMMELGATVCTPRAPKCLLCPLREHCEAFAAGVQELIPLARKREQTPLLKRNVYCICRNGHYLIEQRPAKGRWAGMWQFVTLDAGVKPAALRREVALDMSAAKRLGRITHGLTHRRYEFDVFACEVNRDGHDPSPRRWVTLEQLDAYPLPRPHVKVAAMLREAAR